MKKIFKNTFRIFMLAVLIICINVNLANAKELKPTKDNPKISKELQDEMIQTFTNENISNALKKLDLKKDGKQSIQYQ